MRIEEIQEKVRAGHYVYADHGEKGRQDDGLTYAQVREAILNGEILEQYPDTGRGESCLVVGFAGEIPIHVVCGWRGDMIVFITVYVPGLPWFIDPWTRGGKKR